MINITKTKPYYIDDIYDNDPYIFLFKKTKEIINHNLYLKKTEKQFSHTIQLRAF